MGLPDFGRHSRQRAETIAGSVGHSAILRRYVSANSGAAIYGEGTTPFYQHINVSGMFTPLTTREIQAAGGAYQAGDVFMSLDANNYVLRSTDQIIYSGRLYRIASTDQPMTIAGGGADRVLLKSAEPFTYPNLYHRKVLAHGPVAYWPLWDDSGTTARELVGGYDGTYTNGPTLGAAGIGDGNTAVSFDGINDNVTLPSGIDGGLGSMAELTAVFWIRIASGDWADATLRRPFQLRADVSNIFYSSKGANFIQLLYTAGGTNKFVQLNTSSTEWLCMAITVSKSNDRLKAYSNGAQFGATQTGLGIFTGSLSQRLIGSAGGTAAVIKALMAHGQFYSRELTAAEILDLATV